MHERSFSHNVPALDTLGLRPQEKRALLEEINRRDQSLQHQPERRRPRYRFEPGDVAVQVHHPSGARTSYKMLARNLNSHGIAFLLGRYVYIGTQVAITLMTLDHERVLVTGKVIHCRHVMGMVHEVGVAFDHAIDVDHFIGDPEVGAGAAAVRLTGSVLLIDAHPAQRMLVCHLIQETGMTCVVVSTEREMIDAMRRQRFALVLLDLDNPRLPAADMARSLRAAGHDGPLVGLTVGDEAQALADADAFGCTQRLVKPIDPTALGKVLQQCTDESRDSVLSTFDRDERMRPMLEVFVEEAHEQAARLAAAAEVANLETIEHVLKYFKGNGSGYGFEAVTRLASAALAKIKAGAMPLEEAKPMLEELTGLLGRLKVSCG